jgi:hypothetical protein
MITTIRRYLAGSGPDRLPVSAIGISEPEPIELGEWHRGADDDHDGVGESPRVDDSHGVKLREKGKAMVDNTTGVLEARGSIHPAGRAPTGINNTSKTDEHGADMHMTPTVTVQGGCDQLLQVPGIQHVWKTTTITQEGSASVEGSTWGITWGQNDHMMQQEAEVCSAANDESRPARNDSLRIPKRQKGGYNLYEPFLEATSEDFERGTPDKLRCKFCPRAKFGSWDHFTRHCKSSKRHPLRIHVCNHCGRPFTRKDSLNRHLKTRACKNFPGTNRGV